jgi:hypothetical protein
LWPCKKDDSKTKQALSKEQNKAFKDAPKRRIKVCKRSGGMTSLGEMEQVK